jgi:hypothetical protein
MEHRVKRQQRAEDRRQRTDGRRQQAAGRKKNFELRIAKLGTRPKGGSPQDNCEIRGKESGVRIQEVKT